MTCYGLLVLYIPFVATRRVLQEDLNFARIPLHYSPLCDSFSEGLVLRLLYTGVCIHVTDHESV